MTREPISDTARRDIGSLVAAEDTAWNRGDAVGFTARAMPEVSFTNVLGLYTIGKAGFLAQHERIFATIYKGSTLHQTIEHVATVAPDVAVVDTLAVVTGAQHVPPGITTIDGAIHTRLQQVLIRRHGEWWVAAFHNVAVNPAAAGGAPPPR